MDQDRHAQLADILRQHRHWLKSGKASGRRADLSGAALDGCDFSGADLSGAILTGASLKRAVFREAQLLHANFCDASLQEADFSRANLLLADFTRADLRRAVLSQATTGAHGQVGQLRQGPRFQDADLRGASLQGSYNYRSDFSGARLAGADLSGTDLEGAKLGDNCLVDVDLSHARLLNACLRDSDLSGARLVGAELTHGDLQGARLSGADVSGARLQSANFADAKVDGIRYDRHTRFKGIRVSSCYGSARFRRYAQDQDFIEEFKEAHPAYFQLWWLTTDCGRSLGRVVLLSALLAVLFGLIYYALGEASFTLSNAETLAWSPLTTLYYSVVTFTTLGFGDITPRTELAAILVMVEVVVGYLMLGILISILATKVARRS